MTSHELMVRRPYKTISRSNPRSPDLESRSIGPVEATEAKTAQHNLNDYTTSQYGKLSSAAYQEMWSVWS